MALFFEFRGPVSNFTFSTRAAQQLFSLFTCQGEIKTMAALANPLFWNMKIRIAILTLATFAALC